MKNQYLFNLKRTACQLGAFILLAASTIPSLAIPASAADQHLVIVSIGDSLAAGEGNPDVPSPISGHATWIKPACHQSGINGRRFASDRITDMNGVTATFFDFSCSGAKIAGNGAFLPGGGLLKPQDTDQPNVTNSQMPAQIEQVQEFQTNVLNGRPIDILMISIGVNDINFASIVEACLVPLQLGDCTQSDAVQTATNILNGPSLDSQFTDLANQIRKRLNVKKVYITEYPNEGSSAPNNFCGSNPLDLGDASMANMSDTKNSALFNNLVIPLNGKIQHAVAAANLQRVLRGDLSAPVWTFVRGPQDTFATHGYCTSTHPFFPRRYMNTVQDALLVQGDTNGSMHPNKEGHRAYADALVAQATRDFNLPLEKPRVLRTVETNVNTPDSPLADAGKTKVTVEIAQHPGTLSVVLQHRLLEPLNPFAADHPFISTTMTDSGAGLLNLFTANVPDYNGLLGQQMQYKVVITATRNGETTTTTTATRTLFLTELLVKQ